jgi:hypothetical protein
MNHVVKYRFLPITIPLAYVQARIRKVVTVYGGAGRCGTFLAMIYLATGGMQPIGLLMLNVLASPWGQLHASVPLQSFLLETVYGLSLL